jgi:xylitol oxidase
MTKRTFLKLSAASMCGSPGASVYGAVPQAAEGARDRTNWAGNYRYSTHNLSDLTSIEQIRKFVRAHEFLRVLGTRHCFNGIADSSHALISLKSMDRVVALDPESRTVTVEAGVSYGQLCPYLQEKGFALHNLASLPHISVIGACATATHGSGVVNGNLASAVSALSVVTANGDVLRLSRANDGDMFQGAVVNLGALGVVIDVTLDVQPSYMMRQDVYENLPLAQLTEHYQSIMSSGYSVSLFTNWQNKRINQVWVKRRIERGATLETAPDFYGASLARVNLHPIAEFAAQNCTEQMGVPGLWYERLPHFRMGFTPSAGKELQSEYFVPQKHAVDAILAIERLRNRVGPHLMISELRTVAADQLWMSPCYERPSLAIHFTWTYDWDSVRRVLPVIEKELAGFDARPHWGKLFTLEPRRLQARYERLVDFKGLLKAHDPHGKFQNAFLAETLYA